MLRSDDDAVDIVTNGKHGKEEQEEEGRSRQ